MTALEDLQGNIVDGYAGAHCARLVLCEIVDASRARATLRRLCAVVTRQSEPRRESRGDEQLRLNIAFTYSGLRALGLDASELSGFERDLPFRASMQRRKHLLGDSEQPLELDAHWGERPLHAALLLYLDRARIDSLRPLLEREGELARSAGTCWAEHDGRELRARLREQADAALAELGELAGFALRVVDLHHPLAEGHGLEYFGFRDGISNPAPLRDGSAREFVLHRPGDVLIDGGSFLVVRQLEQDLTRFWSDVSRQAASLGLSATELAERLMGRRQSGAPLDGALPEIHGPAFDPEGARSSCPFASHVRRMNPRIDVETGGNPQIIRRGLSYVAEGGERGLMFFAFNADIAAQFEFMQKNWVQRGNSAGGLSSDFDVIAGTAPLGAKTRFTFTPDKPRGALSFSPFVSLVEGEYLFMPSLPALALIGSEPTRAGTRAHQADPVTELLAYKGALLTHAQRALIQRWLDDGAWALRFWQAVEHKARTDERTSVEVGEYVFIADADEVRRVLENAQDDYAMAEYGARMAPSTGEFFLGMDEQTARYRSERATARFLYEITEEQVAGTACAAVERAFRTARARRAVSDRPSAPATITLRELLATALDAVCGAHFGLPGPSVSSLASWGSDLAKYLFRLFPSESDREKAIQSSQQYRGHVQRLCVERGGRHTHEQQQLEKVCTQIRSALAVALPNDMPVSDDDVVRNLIGIVTGSLGATMKLFSEGLALHLRSHPEARGKITWPSDRGEQTLYEAVIRPALAAGRRGGPDSLYRVRRSDNKLVVLWLGGAQEQAPDILFGSGAHRCPGSHIGRGIIEGVLRALAQCDGYFVGEGDEVRFEFTAA